MNYELAIYPILYSIFTLITVIIIIKSKVTINKQNKNIQHLEKQIILLERESFAKTEFLANISHELRTPLHSIIGFSEIILSENYGKLANDRYKEYVNDIKDSGSHLLAVISDILDLSKASVNKLKVDNIDIDLNKLIKSSLRFIASKAESMGIALICDIPKDHMIIKADPKRLKQVFLNILSNSLKFTESDGTITIKMSKNEEKNLLYIGILDTGIGISSEDIEKALSLFEQVDNKLNRRYEGTGIGLPLAKKLVELMNGTFLLESVVGVGTNVTLSFNYEEE